MRVLIINTSERTGGAAVAASRLMEALINHGVKASMLVRDKESGRPTVCQLPHAWYAQACFLWERLVIWLHLHLRRKHLFDIDIANCGTDITRLPEFRKADVIHLHWVNQGMLSLRDIRRILESGKPVVWTMHDIWPATALCHLTLDCRSFETQCARCRLLPSTSGNDLAARVWRKKQALYQQGRRLTFVACSEWLAGEARKSALTKSHPVCSIPNPIDTRIYCPGDKQAARRTLGLPAEGRVILFVSQRATNPYKGMQYLAEACRLLASDASTVEAKPVLAVLGGHAEEVATGLPLPVYPLGYVSDERRIATVYRAADVFVLPSLSENLPNTIMEAMACGVPCVAFRIGGIPEEIDHKQNGYIANYRDSADLAHGIRYVLHEADHRAMSRHCLSKVAQCWSQQAVASRYTAVYEQALNTTPSPRP